MKNKTGVPPDASKPQKTALWQYSCGAGSGPISTASKIADNLEEHLDKVISGLISN